MTVIPDGRRGRGLPTEFGRSGIHLSVLLVTSWVPALRAADCLRSPQCSAGTTTHIRILKNSPILAIACLPSGRMRA